MIGILKVKEVSESAETSWTEKLGFKEIKPRDNLNISDARFYFDNLFQEMHDKEKEYYTSYEDRMSHTPKEGSELGSWEGERGESKFIPNKECEAANIKLAEYGIDGVEYASAEPDFSKCCEAEVKIEKMTENRENYIDENNETQLGNFAQADTKCAEQWNAVYREGKDNWTAAEVRDWRRENKYSWHECCDTSTMQLVSRDIHSIFRHSGGVAECIVRDNSNTGGKFDE